MLDEDEDFSSLPVIEEFTQEKNLMHNVPECLKYEPKYNLTS